MVDVIWWEREGQNPLRFRKGNGGWAQTIVAARLIPIPVKWNGGVSRGTRTLQIKTNDLLDDHASNVEEAEDSDDSDHIGFEAVKDDDDDSDGASEWECCSDSDDWLLLVIALACSEDIVRCFLLFFAVQVPLELLMSCTQNLHVLTCAENHAFAASWRTFEHF